MEFEIPFYVALNVNTKILFWILMSNIFSEVMCQQFVTIKHVTYLCPEINMLQQ